MENTPLRAATVQHPARKSLQRIAKLCVTGIMGRMGLAAKITKGVQDRHRISRNAFSGLLSGMAASVTVYETHSYVYPHISTMTAMRGDWVRIGKDFNVVMAREREEAKKK